MCVRPSTQTTEALSWSDNWAKWRVYAECHYCSSRLTRSRPCQQARQLWPLTRTHLFISRLREDAPHQTLLRNTGTGFDTRDYKTKVSCMKRSLLFTFLMQHLAHLCLLVLLKYSLLQLKDHLHWYHRVIFNRCCLWKLDIAKCNSAERGLTFGLLSLSPYCPCRLHPVPHTAGPKPAHSSMGYQSPHQHWSCVWGP